MFPRKPDLVSGKAHAFLRALFAPAAKTPDKETLFCHICLPRYAREFSTRCVGSAKENITLNRTTVSSDLSVFGVVGQVRAVGCKTAFRGTVFIRSFSVGGLESAATVSPKDRRCT